LARGKEKRKSRGAKREAERAQKERKMGFRKLSCTSKNEKRITAGEKIGDLERWKRGQTQKK